MIFVDTSAFFALADRADEEHEQARCLYDGLLRAKSALTTHSYIVVETAALMQRRLSAQAASSFLRDMEHFPVVWVDHRLHERGVERFLRAARRGISLVDCVSFALMEESKMTTAFAFDSDFVHAGFSLYT